MIYLLAFVLFVGDVLLGWHLWREKRRHALTSDALRYWRRYSTERKAWPAASAVTPSSPSTRGDANTAETAHAPAMSGSRRRDWPEALRYPAAVFGERLAPATCDEFGRFSSQPEQGRGVPVRLGPAVYLMQSSRLEQQLARALELAGVPPPVREYRFHATRRWRFDFAWPDRRIAVEVEGGVFAHGRHTRGSGFSADCEKYNAASLDGWIVIRVTGQHIRSGQAQLWIRQALSREDLRG